MKKLQQLLRQIDHKGYPNYKQLRGKYNFSGYTLSIDHVQGDPFAAPSKVSVWVTEKVADFDRVLFSTKERKVAVLDALLRRMGRELKKVSFQAKGSGKSGLMSVSIPGQEVLPRSACEKMQDGTYVLRMEVGFPARGRTIDARELEKIFFDYLPKCVEKSMFARAYRENELQEVADLAEDQQALRQELKKRDLVAFVANGAILPRESGVSNRPLKEAIPFTSPSSMEISVELPHQGKLTGMGIPKGVTLIVGGGYHGKSTLLRALELGVYNHIKGDGREFVITDECAMKLRAEDGRSIKNVDISMFIQNLPNQKDTVSFSTEDASGSTSQAAGVVEAWEAGSTVLLMDEDTSATNFMIRDELMQKVVSGEEEPITPYLTRVRDLYEKEGISTILVAGSCGSYFHKADVIIQMKQYVPQEITEYAKKVAAEFPWEESTKGYEKPKMNRVFRENRKWQGERIKSKVMGVNSLMIDRDTIELRYVEQLVDSEQVALLAEIVKYAKLGGFDGNKNLQELVVEVHNQIEKKGFAGIVGGTLYGGYAMPRVQEIFACLNRYRKL